MLADAELVHLAAQHSRYNTENYKHYETQRDILVKFKEVVSEYTKLKKAYEELTEGKESNPYVLVLIDGDTYRFEEALLQRREEGGASAARLLSDSIQSCLSGTPLEEYQIVVRVYCNIAETSRVLSRSHLVGAEKRSLCPFAAGFTSSTENYDFVDAGDRPDAVLNKIHDAVSLYAESSSCKHILLGSCNSADYAELAAGNRNNVTLVRSAPFDTDAVRNALNPDIFPTGFSSTPNTAAPTNGGIESTHLRSKWANHTEGEKGSINSPDSSEPPASRKLRPYRPAGFGSEEQPRSNHSNPTATFFVSKPEHAGKVPVNCHGQRLDSHIPRPSKEAWDAYAVRVRGTKLCNNFHLGAGCLDGDDCRFDHDPVDEDTVTTLRSLARSIPCPRKMNCRLSKCVNGHICAKPGCPGTGKYCKLRPFMHGLDGRLDSWVPAHDADEGDNRRNGSVATTGRSRGASTGVSLASQGDHHADDWTGGWDRGPEPQAGSGWEAPSDDWDRPTFSGSQKGNEWQTSGTARDVLGSTGDSAADWPGPQSHRPKLTPRAPRESAKHASSNTRSNHEQVPVMSLDDTARDQTTTNETSWTSTAPAWEPSTATNDDRNISW